MIQTDAASFGQNDMMRQLTMPQALAFAALILTSAYFLGDWAGYPYLAATFLVAYAYTVRRRTSCRRV